MFDPWSVLICIQMLTLKIYMNNWMRDSYMLPSLDLEKSNTTSNRSLLKVYNIVHLVVIGHKKTWTPR